MRNRITLAIAILVLVLAVEASLSPAAGTKIDLAGNWKFKVDPENVGLQRGWHSPQYDASTWRGVTVPGTWESQGVTQANPHYQQNDPSQPYNGFAWYRRSVNIPAEWKGKTVYLRVGRIDDNDWTYVNGRLIGQTISMSPPASSVFRIYTVPSDAVKFGQSNVIAVRVEDTMGDGGIAQGPVIMTIDKLALQTQTSARNDHAQDIVRFAGDVIIEPHQTADDVVSLGGNIIVKGHVTGDAVTFWGNIKVCSSGRIDGDAVAILGKIEMSDGAHVGGEIDIYKSSLKDELSGPGAIWILTILQFIYTLVSIA